MPDIQMKKPSAWPGELWRESLPVGNGLTSALLCGSVGHEYLWFNRFDRWENAFESELPDVSDTLEKTRAELRAGNYAAANACLSDALRERGYENNLATPKAPIELRLRFVSETPFRQYKRGIDFETGEAYMSFKQNDDEQTRSLFISRATDTAVFKVASTGEIHVKIDKFSDDRLNMVIQNDDGTFADEGEYFEIVGAHSFTIFAKFDEAPSTEPYEIALEKHLLLYRKAMGSADLRLSDSETPMEKLLDEALETRAPLELYDRLWHFGRYLFASGTCEGGNPFPLYGLWNGAAKAPWAQNVANENVQMIYWHAPVGGYAELLKPLIHYYYSKMDAFRKSARNLFGCRGIWVSTYTTPLNSLPAPNVPVIVNYIGCAGWLCKHFYDYYLYTNDEELLNKEILPFMLETAAFFEDYLFRDEAGKICIMPSVSPENSPANFVPKDLQMNMTHCNPVVWNSTMDFGILKSLLTNLLSLSEAHPMDANRIATWKGILQDIPDYMVNKEGAIKEWMSDEMEDHYGHRHLSHIYPLFPGEEIGKDDPLFGAFVKAVDLRKLGTMSGWAFAHMSSIYARMGQGDRALNCLDTMSRGCVLSNGFTLHNDWRDMGISLHMEWFPVQLDALLGWVNAMQEMLLRVRKGECLFLPACPTMFDKGEVRDWCIPGAKVSFNWNRKENRFSATVRAERAISVKLHYPDWVGKAPVQVILSEGESYTL